MDPAGYLKAFVSIQSKDESPEQDASDLRHPPLLKQAFPVVLPLSDQKWGPQDTHHPDDVWPKLVKDELADDDWVFRRDRAQAAILREQRMASAMRQRAEQAERDADAAAALAADRCVDLEWSSKDRERRGVVTTQVLDSKLQEAEELHREALGDCERRLAQARQLLEQEQAHTMEVEQLLRQQQECSGAAERRVAEIESQSLERRHQRGTDAAREAERLDGRVEAARQAAAQRIRTVQHRAAHDLKMMRDQLEAVKLKCGDAVSREARRKGEAEQEAEHRQDIAAERLGVEQQCMKHCAVSAEDDCYDQLQRVQRREQKTAHALDEWREGAVSVLFQTAAVKSQDAHRREQLATHSLEHAVHHLGHHHSTHRQYNTVVDSKISSVLQGALHDHPTAHALGAPSARSLNPPRDTAAIGGDLLRGVTI